MRTFLAIVFAAVLTSQALAQEQVVLASTEPKTQLEAFATRTGTVMVKGFTTMGTVRGQKNTFVEVVCKEFVDTSSGQKAYGITVTVTDAGGDPSRARAFYVDYDELESLIKGLEYCMRIDKSITRLDDFKADYRTKGDLTVSIFRDSDGIIQSSLGAGLEGPFRAYLTIDGLGELRALLGTAKAKLDSIRP